MDPKISSSLVKFAVDFCNELGKHRTTVCSPLSAEWVLALLALAGRGGVRAELLAALGAADVDALRSSFSYLATTLQSAEGVTLNMANKVYLKSGSELKPDIKKDAEEIFGSSLEQLDFNEGEASAALINKWVEEKTDGMIKNIVTADKFNEETRLVLVNAIYFQGNWEWPFSKKRTTLGDFYVNNATKIKVPQMSKTGQFFFYGVNPELKAKMISMYYQGRKASMVIVLPDEITGLGEVIEKLKSGHDLMTDIKQLVYTKVNVKIPKFEAEITIDLKTLLPKLGIKSIFDPGSSDIDMLTSGERLVVTEAVQKAFIVVDEKGTKASAASIFPEMPCSIRRTPSFTADRPYLYLLLVQKTPIFVGVYEGSEYAEETK